MFQTKKVIPEFSFITPGFYYEYHLQPLRSQLLNLNNQTNLNFEVIILDLHYSKRNSEIEELSKELNFNLTYAPYLPNFKIPKLFDYCIFNNLVLLSSTPKIIIYQEWRYFHPNFIELLSTQSDKSFIGIEWQIFNKREFVLDGHSVADVNFDDAEKCFNYGIFPPNLEPTMEIKDNFDGIWGHYCIDKSLWLEIGGIDEVSTNLKHYADLDLNQRLINYFDLNNIKIEFPFFKNVCLRLTHNKGSYMGGSFVPLDIMYNEDHKNCCSIDINFSKLSHNDFILYVEEKINSNIYKQLNIETFDVIITEEINEEDLKNENIITEEINEENTENENIIIENNDFFKNENIITEEINEEDIENENNEIIIKYYRNYIEKQKIITFQCNNCKVTGETPHWYEKIPKSRIKSHIGIGINGFKLGRNLKLLYEDICLLNFESKIVLLNNSWYNEKYLKN